MSIQAPANVSGTVSSKDEQQAAFVERLKRLYSADQQAEYLFIQAEADSLLVELERLKALQKQAVQAG